MIVSVLISNSQPKCPNTFEIHAFSAISTVVVVNAQVIQWLIQLD